MKTIKVKPVETLVIELTDKTYTCYFNVLCVANMQEELAKLKCKLTDISPARMISMILYSSINAGKQEDRISRKEANSLAISLNPSAYGEIYNSYFESIMDSLPEDKKEQTKKEMARMISSAMKSISE